ncbi:MAG: alpha-amylase [Deltaproteobacteria bacterium]|nr:MAG: alpha-amylase [Deltaproteobacteria bacterium]
MSSKQRQLRSEQQEQLSRQRMSWWMIGLYGVLLLWGSQGCLDYFPPDKEHTAQQEPTLDHSSSTGPEPTRQEPPPERLTQDRIEAADEPQAEADASPEAREPVREEPATEPAPDRLGHVSTYWWQDAVIYQLMLRSFQDSDGDGIGDIKGLISRLDYLNDGDPNTTDDLGVNAIWLLPIFKAHSEHGYDTIDYQAIQPEYGTLQDFKNLVKEAHRRGIRVVLDMVFNHTSDLHPWFKDASASPTSSKRDWYVWRDTNPNWQQPWGGGTSWHPLNGFFYYGVFWKGMPDLNFRHPPVRQQMTVISHFWLSQGVDGFRFDAARYMVEGKTSNEQGDQPETHAYWREYRTNIKKVSKQVMLVGEVWTDIGNIIPYCKGDEFDLVFHFPIAEAIYQSITKRQSYGLWRALEASYAMPFTCWSAFLSNHDQVRIMTRLNKNMADMRTAAWLFLTLPGTPFLYYGEEIGTLQGTENKGYDTRAPMAWTAAPQGGFTQGKPWHPLPQHDKANVAGQTQDPNSLLSLYRKLIRVRNNHRALRTGTFAPLILDGQGVSAVVAFIRTHEKQRLAVVVNMGQQPIQKMTLKFSIDVGSMRTVASEGKVTLYPPTPNNPKFHYVDLEAGGAAVLELLPASP